MTVLDDFIDLRLTVQNLYILLRYSLDRLVYSPENKLESKLKIDSNIENMVYDFC